MLAREYPNASEIPRRATSDPHGTQGEGKGLAMSEREEEMNPKEFEAFKNLIMIQLERIRDSETLEEAKKANEQLIKALKEE